MEIRRTTVESPEFLGLLQAYEKLQSIFNIHEVENFLSDLTQEEQDALDLLRLNSILYVDSFEFKLLKARAYMYLAQTEEDLIKLRLVLEEIAKISSNIAVCALNWDHMKALKLAYLHNIVPLFAKYLDKHLMKRTEVLSYLMLSILRIETNMHNFVQDILSARDGVYEEIYKSLPDSSIIPHEKSHLNQFLKENVTDRIDILRGRVPKFSWI